MQPLPLVDDPPRGFAATRNACNVCTPLGACLVFRGIERAIPLLHGSQGCSTYIRRYLIGHFREPVDIASSNFSESTAVHGGRQILHQGLENVIRQYAPELIGIASTCLSETIGDDISLYVKEFRRDRPDRVLPELVHVSTPSYRDTHAEGFHAAVKAVVETLAQSGPPKRLVNLLPGMVSPADLRYLKEVVADFELPAVLLPDYSDSLDGGTWADYERLPSGGTTLEAIRKMGQAVATIEFGSTQDPSKTAGCAFAGSPWRSPPWARPAHRNPPDRCVFRHAFSLLRSPRAREARRRARSARRRLHRRSQVPGEHASLDLRRRRSRCRSGCILERARNQARALRLGRTERAAGPRGQAVRPRLSCSAESISWNSKTRPGSSPATS